jgi:hypothetical protein
MRLSFEGASFIFIEIYSYQEKKLYTKKSSNMVETLFPYIA